MSVCSGDKCSRPGCNGLMATRSSRQSGEFQVRYLRCQVCGNQARSIVTASNVRSISWRRSQHAK